MGAAVTLARGMDPEAVRAGLRSFRGLKHRLEEVATVDGVLYVNDSKATNIASALVGIASFPGGVHAILGGRSKGGGFAELVPVVAERCRAAYLIGETAAELRAALAPAGVAHRLEEVATHDGVLYVNDSKATNVASAIAGIESFEGGLHLILGGSAKAADYGPLARPVAERARAVYLIGETGPEIGAALAGTGVPLHDVHDLERAVAEARRAARAGEVVLLSPACASFDQYPDYEARGEHFRALVS